MEQQYVSYIIDSTDPDYKAAYLLMNDMTNTKGEQTEFITDGGHVSLVGLGAISYSNDDELVDKCREVMQELGI